MDNLTHSLVGALIGQAGLKRKTGLAMPALIIGANIPDIDATCTIYGIESLAMRRGLTHGPIAWVLLPLVLAGLLYGWDRWQAQGGFGRGKRPEGRLPVHFGWLYALAFIACLTHPALDWMNSYGIRLLEPFSSRWFYGDVLFIIDVWLWLGLGFATWLSLQREKRGAEWRWSARVALAIALAYIGLNAAITFRIERKEEPWLVGNAKVIANPVPVRFWRREVLIGRQNDWYSIADGHPGGAVELVRHERRCMWPDLSTIRARRADVDAFLFWSRAPYVERAPDGTISLRDSRFGGALGGARFTVSIPISCEPIAVVSAGS